MRDFFGPMGDAERVITEKWERRPFLHEKIESLFVACRDQRGPRVDLLHLLAALLEHICGKTR